MLEILYPIAKQFTAITVVMGFIGLLLNISKEFSGKQDTSNSDNITKKKIKINFNIVFLIIALIVIIPSIYINYTYTEMPYIVGKTYIEAEEKLYAHSFLYETPLKPKTHKKDPNVLVSYQYPVSGTIIRRKSFIDLYFEDYSYVPAKPILYNSYELEKSAVTLVETSLRRLDEEGIPFRKGMSVQVGDEFEIQIHYKNIYEQSVSSVMVRAVLPEG